MSRQKITVLRGTPTLIALAMGLFTVLALGSGSATGNINSARSAASLPTSTVAIYDYPDAPERARLAREYNRSLQVGQMSDLHDRHSPAELIGIFSR